MQLDVTCLSAVLLQPSVCLSVTLRLVTAQALSTADLRGDNRMVGLYFRLFIYNVCLHIQNPSPWWRVTLIFIYVAKLSRMPCLTFLSRGVKKRDLNVCQIEVG